MTSRTNRIWYVGLALLLACQSEEYGCSSPTGPSCDAPPSLAMVGQSYPDDLSAENVGADVVLAWTGAPDAVSVSVRRRSQSNGAFPTPFEEIAALAGDPAAFVDESVAPGAYVYQIRRCAAATGPGQCTRSNIVQIAVAEPSGVPTPPTDLTADLSGRSVQLDWRNTATADTIKVLRAAGAPSSEEETLGAYQTVAALPGTATAFLDDGVPPGWHRYKLTSCNDGCRFAGRFSNQAQAFSNEVEIEVAVAPEAPTDFSAIPSGLFVRLHFSPGVGADYIAVLRGPSGGGLVEIARLEPDDTFFEDEVPGVGSYSYKLDACNVYGCAAAELDTEVTGLPQRTYLRGSAELADVELSWSRVPEADEWRLFRRYLGAEVAVNGEWEQIASVLDQFVYDDLVAPGIHEYRVDGCNVFGCTESNVVAIESEAIDMPLHFAVDVPSDPSTVTYFRVVLPEASEDPAIENVYLLIRSLPALGDTDFYIRQGVPPTPTEWDCSSSEFQALIGPDDYCTAGVGTWYVMVPGGGSSWSTADMIAQSVTVLSGSSLEGVSGEPGSRRLLRVGCIEMPIGPYVTCWGGSSNSRLAAETSGGQGQLDVSVRQWSTEQAQCYVSGEGTAARCEVDFHSTQHYIELFAGPEGYSDVTVTWNHFYESQLPNPCAVLVDRNS